MPNERTETEQRKTDEVLKPVDDITKKLDDANRKAEHARDQLAEGHALPGSAPPAHGDGHNNPLPAGG